MIPIARTQQLLIQEVGNEVIVYDRVNHNSHCLNPVAARVWNYCDGQHSVKDIAKLLEKELNISQTEDVDMRGLVWLTLEELERYQLIEKYVKQPVNSLGISRRTVIKTGTIIGGVALGTMFPVIKSVAVPDPGGSQSTANPPKKPPKCKIITKIGATCQLTSVTIDNRTVYSCSDSGCKKIGGGFCKERPKANSVVPDCICVEKLDCIF